MGIRFLTAGESHGPALSVIVDGVPSGLALSSDDFTQVMQARRSGHGRGGRMKIESDQVQITAGVRHGKTMGSPLALHIENKDFANWLPAMQVSPLSDELEAREQKPIHCPRPGHADLAGGLKHQQHDMRNVLERASARETAARVVAGTVARQLLGEFGIQLRSHVVQIGEVRSRMSAPTQADDPWWDAVEASPVRCGDEAAAAEMIQLIDATRQAQDTVGGTFEVFAFGTPPGFGDYAQWDRRLDGKLAQAVMSIPGIKGVEMGLGFGVAAAPGSRVHDPINYTGSFGRASNHAGGIEGGMSNGEPICLRGAMKPLATLMKPLPSVDVRDKSEARGHLERADVCVVPAAGVVAEAMSAWVLADAVLAKCGGDSLGECVRNYQMYCQQLCEY